MSQGERFWLIKVSSVVSIVMFRDWTSACMHYANELPSTTQLLVWIQHNSQGVLISLYANKVILSKLSFRLFLICMRFTSSHRHESIGEGVKRGRIFAINVSAATSQSHITFRIWRFTSPSGGAGKGAVNSWNWKYKQKLFGASQFH